MNEAVRKVRLFQNNRNQAVRKVRLFQNNRNQAVRIPKDFEFDGEEVLVRKDGDRLVIEPVPTTTLISYLANAQPLDVDFPNIDDSLPEEVEL